MILNESRLARDADFYIIQSILIDLGKSKLKKSIKSKIGRTKIGKVMNWFEIFFFTFISSENLVENLNFL